MARPARSTHGYRRSTSNSSKPVTNARSRKRTWSGQNGTGSTAAARRPPSRRCSPPSTPSEPATTLCDRGRARYASTLWSSEQHASEVRREVEALDAGSTGPYLDHYIGLLRGYLAEWDGHFEEALAWTQRALKSSEALGMRERAGAGYRMRARTELLAGDPTAARASLEQSDRILAELGERSLRSTTQAWLAEVNAELGDRDGALAAIELAEELGADEDFVNFVSTHGVRATLALAEHD